MSRSYKKTAYWGDRKDKDMKRIANHRVRQALKNPNTTLHGNDYRKLFESWDICDYCHIEHGGFLEYYKDCVCKWEHRRNIGRPYADDKDLCPPSKQDTWRDWTRHYRRK